MKGSFSTGTADVSSRPASPSGLAVDAAARSPALLTMAGYYGTLAATRCLGSSGIPVTIADAELLAPARWSKFATRRVFCPNVQESDRFVEWLLRFGEKNPGHVLYPAADDVAWIYSLHRDELSKHFHLYQPPVQTIYTLLNKELLRRACLDAGIEMPQTWFLNDDADLDRLANELPYPVLLKPQSQILFWPHSKGKLVRSPETLRPIYEELRRNTSYAPAFLAYDPAVARPLIQVYVPRAVQGIYNLSGFVDETGDLFAVRASRKVLQQPRQLGVGLCFEEAAVEPQVAQRLQALCRKVGYFGVFEVEFIESDGKFILIDFNPRYYGQMAFDIARGLPLPLLVQDAALGRRDRLREAVARAGADTPAEGRAHCNRIDLGLLLRGQRLSGSIDASVVDRWRRWLAEHQGGLTDSILHPSDPQPGYAYVLAQSLHYLRHPRSLVQQLKYEV